jgi:broad specificity phosphatase PhoE
VINDGKKIIIDSNLREFNFGLWDGLDFNEVAKRDPIKSKDFWEKPGDISAPEGESWNMVKNRVSEAVKKYTAKYKGSNIVCVAHFGVILTQVQLALGKSPYEVLSNKIDNLSVTKIQINERGSSLTKLNYTP